MSNFDANKSWQTKNITALENPISEFNARGGMDLDSYQSLQDHMAAEHPNLAAESWATIKATLPTIETVADPNGQRIRMQRFNWPTEPVGDTTINVFNTSFSVPISFEHLQYGAYRLAEVLDGPLVVFENPGYGKSDALTPAQSTALKHNGDFGPVAESMLSILKDLGVTNLNCIGYSLGAETTSAIAAHASKYGMNVQRLFAMEAPRVTKQNILRLGKNFFGGSKDIKFAWNHPADPVLRKTAKLKLSRQRGALAYARAMSSGKLEEDLIASLESQPEMEVVIASASQSNISPLVANMKLVDHLQASYPNRKIGRIIAPGETHAFGDNVPLYSQMAKLALRS